MTDIKLADDLQASSPEIALALSRAGVNGVQKAVRIRRGDAETVMAAVIDCTVDLAADQKGVHMSRFPELFEEAIELVVEREALLVEVLAEHIASQVVERQGSLRAEVWIRAQWPIHRKTPVTGLATQEMVTLCGIAAASETGTRRAVGVEATGINACPCAQGLVRNRASERLLEAGFESDDVDKILDLVPIATHNQRGRQTLFVGTEQDLDAELLVDIAERSMSAPIYDLLKRPDELFVVEHAHLQPRFVEDSVRHALRDALDTLALQAGQLRDDPRPRRRRRAVRDGRRAPERARDRRAERPPDDARRLARRLAGLAPELEAVLGAAQEAADVLAVHGDDGHGARNTEGDDRPRVAEHDDEHREPGRGDDRRE
jgi:GTP cyclohydrolase I/GTP cyclohydrolase-4